MTSCESGASVGIAVGFGIGVGELEMAATARWLPIPIPTIRVSPRTSRHKVTSNHTGIDTVRLCLRGSSLAMTVLPLPVYANYAAVKWNLMSNSYLDSVYWSIMGMHIYNKKDGKCRCSSTHISLTQTLTQQRRAEIDSIRPAAPSAGLFCCHENGGDI